MILCYGRHNKKEFRFQYLEFHVEKKLKLNRVKWIIYTDFRFLVFLILLIVQKCRHFWKGRGDILEDYVYFDNFTEIINLNQSVLSIETAFYL